MEFYVAKGPLTFYNLYKNPYSDPDFDFDIKTKRAELLEEPLTLEPVTDCVGELIEGCYCNGENSFQMALRTMLSWWGWGWEWHWVIRQSKSVSLTVYLTMTSTNTASVKILTRNGDNGEYLSYQIFERLMKSDLLPTSFEWNLNLKVLDIGFEVDGKNFEVEEFEEKHCYGLVMTGIEITEDMWSKWKRIKGQDDDEDVSGDSDDDDGDDRDNEGGRDQDVSMDEDDDYKGFEGEMTLTLRLDHSAITNRYLETLGSTETLWPRNLIIEGVPSDLVILAGGEKEKDKGIKCHKEILSGRSPVFTAMFQADMSESKDNSLEIVDMTEDGVRAMLQFIYAKDLEEASKKCEIAVELLEAGHKYGMADLEDAMMQLIWAKPVEWVSVDLALKMLLFSRNIGGKFEEIEKTGLAILKWYAQKSGSLMASQEFQRLYMEYPRIALELAESFLKI